MTAARAVGGSKDGQLLKTLTEDQTEIRVMKPAYFLRTWPPRPGYEITKSDYETYRLVMFHFNTQRDERITYNFWVADELSYDQAYHVIMMGYRGIQK